MAETTTSESTPEQQAAQVRLEAILSDPSHPYNVAGHRHFDVAAAEVLELRRVALGDQNQPLVSYRQAEDPAPVAPAAPVPLSLSYTREDLVAGLPVPWPAPEAQRFVTAALDVVGATPFEAMRLVNLTNEPAPDPADELDLDELWGAATPDNVRTVNWLLTRIRRHDAELHDRLLPYVQRRADVANHVLAVAQRHATRR